MEIKELRAGFSDLTVDYQKIKQHGILSKICLKQSFKQQYVDIEISPLHNAPHHLAIRLSSRHCNDCTTSLLRLIKKEVAPSDFGKVIFIIDEGMHEYKRILSKLGCPDEAIYSVDTLALYLDSVKITSPYVFKLQNGKYASDFQIFDRSHKKFMVDYLDASLH